MRGWGGEGGRLDGIGVGKKLGVAVDAPHLDKVYKLVEYAGRPRTKLSSKKIIYPGRKQVFRRVEAGRMVRDVIGRDDEKLDGEPLLQPVMRGGARLADGQGSLALAPEHAPPQRQ